MFQFLSLTQQKFILWRQWNLHYQNNNMIQKKKIAAICGSTRATSANLNLIKAITELTKDRFEITIFEGIGELPHFNPDNNNENISAKVIAFRQLISTADAVIICTPEYAHGIPGSLKNAIDWTVSTNEFSQKPVALITASTEGTYAHKAMLETLRVIEAKNIDKQNLLIQFAKTKINVESQITDETTLDEVIKLIQNLEKSITEQL
jgi:chromate reductase, NAD(P)H dehydrogenase (quinone)